MTFSPPRREIGIVLYPGAQVSAVLAMTDLFLVSRRFLPADDAEVRTPIRISHWKLGDGQAEPGRVFASDPGPQMQPYVLILPPSLDGPPSAEVAAPYLDWLRAQHAGGTVLASVCAGAFLLAETGLLDDRPATTHWTHEDGFRERFPRARLDVDRLLIDDGDIVTAGGLMSWTDLCLCLLGRLWGPEIMAQTARFLLVDPPGREQRYYSIFSPPMGHGDTAILKVQHLIHATEAREVPLAALAESAGLERRTFLRRFRKATGMTTSEYCQRLRIKRACELLQFKRQPVEQVAWDSGYSDVGAFRKIFARFVGLTPSEYRQRFGSFS